MPTADEPGGDHARGAVLLSGARPRRNTVSPYLGTTIDQMIANRHGQDTILSSLQLGVEDAGNYGNCNWGYSCAYTNCISWSAPTQPLPPEVNPRVVFERLFGDGTSTEERRRDRKRNASILDAVAGQLASFKQALGAGDKARVHTYLAYFVEKLKNIPDGDGSVLDHVLIYKGSNMGNSHRHAHEKVPVILVGGIDGTFKGNRHLVFPDNTQRTSNMLLSILHLYGIDQ